MKILLGGTSDNGGGSWFLAQAINRYTKHQARAVRSYQSYLAYPYDALNPTAGEMDSLIGWADVVHMRDALPKSSVGLRGKAVVITYTGRVFRKCSGPVYRAHRLGYKICVSTPDMMAFCPDVKPTWLPNPREDLAHLWKPRRNSFAVQAPTSRQGKQTAIVRRAARKARLPLRIVEKMSYAKCLAQKAQCRVTVDQIKYGFGNNAIEGWALGMPVISGFSTPLAQQYREAILMQVGGELPFIEVIATPDSVAEALLQLRKDKEFYHAWRLRGREYFFRYHHMPVVAKKAIGIYQQVLGG